MNTPDSIGMATLQPDGRLELTLRAEGPGGLVGDARVVYRPGDANYAQVLQHVGGLSPGESKPVPPFASQPAETK
jgi:hypothetical protein